MDWCGSDLRFGVSQGGLGLAVEQRTDQLHGRWWRLVAEWEQRLLLLLLAGGAEMAGRQAGGTATTDYCTDTGLMGWEGRSQ
jgi:hypothetical protein